VRPSFLWRGSQSHAHTHPIGAPRVDRRRPDAGRVRRIRDGPGGDQVARREREQSQPPQLRLGTGGHAVPSRHARGLSGRDRLDGRRAAGPLRQQPHLQRPGTEHLLGERSLPVGMDLGPVHGPHVRPAPGRGGGRPTGARRATSTPSTSTGGARRGSSGSSAGRSTGIAPTTRPSSSCPGTSCLARTRAATPARRRRRRSWAAC
jgi:hypothetical protein